MIFRLNCINFFKPKVQIDDLVTYPKALKDLMTMKSPLQSSFLQNIRNYNSAFSFASFGANLVKPPGIGPYCFRIHGQIYHKISAFHPNENDSQSFQSFIYFGL